VKYLVAIWLIFKPFSAFSQGTFQNLDFEQANPVVVVGSPYYPYEVTVASALPYWTVTYGTVQQTQMLFDDMSLGAPSVDLLGAGDVYSPAPIDGNYSVFLQGSGDGTSASISQTGLIPFGTQSLLFEAQGNYGSPPGPLEVLIGTQSVPFSALGGGPNYTLYGADISAWAGETEQLTFSAVENIPQENNWEIDDISFSPTAVPEPSTLALVLTGGVAFGARRFRTSRYCALGHNGKPV
jgi:hypothetical protein